MTCYIMVEMPRLERHVKLTQKFFHARHVLNLEAFDKQWRKNQVMCYRSCSYVKWFFDRPSRGFAS